MSTSPGPETHRPSPGTRHRARERALELLYEADSKSLAPGELLAELPLAPDEYAAALVTGLERRLEEVRGLVAAHASGWSLERMPVVDRLVLELATFELLERREVPVAVVLDEAVELAKTYSTEDSGRYVNGVLSAVAAEIRGQVAGHGPAS